MAARNELKYLVDVDTRRALQPVLQSRLLPGEHVDESGGYPVLSLYYDGEELPYYLEKVAGLGSRMKVRLRAYGWELAAASTWFLEAKHKEVGAIAKRRLVIPAGTIDPLRPETWDVLGEKAGPFLRARESLHLVPVVQVWYQREVLVSPNSDLRVTWDTCVRALYPGEAMTTRLLYDPTRAVVPDSCAVLEIKTAQTLPAWLAGLVRSASLTFESVSKYVRAVDALGLSRKVLSTC